MDQVICASLSHTHYWYEMGMLKVPAKYTTLINALGESFILSVVQSLYIIPLEKRFFSSVSLLIHCRYVSMGNHPYPLSSELTHRARGFEI